MGRRNKHRSTTRWISGRFGCYVIPQHSGPKKKKRLPIYARPPRKLSKTELARKLSSLNKQQVPRPSGNQPVDRNTQAKPLGRVLPASSEKSEQPAEIHSEMPPRADGNERKALGALTHGTNNPPIESTGRYTSPGHSGQVGEPRDIDQNHPVQA